MTVVKHILRIIERTNEWVGKTSSFLFVFAMFILIFEVTSRYFFNAPTIWAHEISQTLYGIAFMLGGAYGLLLGSHVLSDVLVGRLRPRARAIVDILFSVVFFFFCIILTIRGTEIAIESVRIMETTHSIFRSPVWPVKLAIPIGSFLLFMQGLAKLIRDIHIATTGEKLQ